MATLFVSDLHLSLERPEKLALFAAFMEGPARAADALYILGDLVEAWLGDDDDRPPNPEILARIKALADSGVPVHVAHGNRDFLMRDRFCAESGATLLPEEARVDLHGEAALLMHGDTLCTADVEYLTLRRQLRDPGWQARMLALPLADRIAFAARLRSESIALSSKKDQYIMDVTQQAVDDVMTRHDVRLLIHGHTHRPAVHHFTLEGQPATRIVLGDWYEQDSVLVCEPGLRRLLRVSEYIGG